VSVKIQGLLDAGGQFYAVAEAVQCPSREKWFWNLVKGTIKPSQSKQQHFSSTNQNKHFCFFNFFSTNSFNSFFSAKKFGIILR
jgi:hypothetical protein